MTYDSRSRERLEALGRRLPKLLPAPEPAATSSAPSTDPRPRRHRLETENDPQQLFRELISASPDGTVPPHLIERLRELEQRPSTAEPTRTRPRSTGSRSTGSRRSNDGAATRRRGGTPLPSRALSAEEQQQYATFAHLLLEDGEQD